MKTEAEEFKGGEAERSGGEELRLSREGGAGQLDGLKGGDSAESDLKDDGGVSFDAGAAALRLSREGAAGLLEGLKGGDSAESDLKEGLGESLETGAGAGAGAGAELRTGARTTTTDTCAPPRFRPRVTTEPSGPGTRAFTASQVAVGHPSTERRRSAGEHECLNGEGFAVGTIRENVGIGKGCCSEGIEGAHDRAVRSILEHKADAA